MLYSFNPQGGAGPGGGPLVFDATGSLYGTVGGGDGIYAGGTVFKLTPSGGGIWTETVLHSFNENGTDGYHPGAGAIFDAAGKLYGTTEDGGTNGCGVPGLCGTVYELTPVRSCIRCNHADLQ